MSLVRFRPEAPFLSELHRVIQREAHAGVAHLVERHLAKVEVASSSLVIRSKHCDEMTLSPEEASFVAYRVP